MKMKTVSIKGKEYVTVAERVKAFHELYPNGSIKTELLSSPEANRIVFRCAVTPEETEEARQRVFTGYASESIGDGFINKTSAMENAETSAVGRALGFLNIGIVDSVASVDEITKANNNAKGNPGLNRPTDEHRRTIANLMAELGITYSPDNPTEWTEFCIDAIGVANPLNQDQAEDLIIFMQDRITNGAMKHGGGNATTQDDTMPTV